MYRITLYIFFITAYTFGCCTSCVNQTHHKKVYNGIDAALYQDTPSWDLVHAMDVGNWEQAKEEIKKDSSLANFKEPNYGNSVLFWAALNSNDKAVELLLSFGAEVNKGNFSGDSPLEMAAFYNDCESHILGMLLTHQPGEDSLTLYFRNEALVLASKKCLNNVKLLIDSGADPNWISKTETPLKTLTPLSASVVREKFDIAAYYLIELGVNPSTGRITSIDGDTILITELLQKSYNVERTFDQEKTRQQIQKILDFLEKKDRFQHPGGL